MKNILITGGSDGLGKTIAKVLAKNNNVVIASPTANKVKEVAGELKVNYMSFDVSNSVQTQNAVDEFVKKYGKIDVLINNAGLWIQGALTDNDYDRIAQVVEVNLTGVINMTKAVLPYMEKEKDGLIVNINSQAGINYKKERSVYNATKWGVTGFTKSIQDEVNKKGIRVTDLMPGKMKTKMFEKMGIEKPMDDGLETIEVAKVIEFLMSLPNDVTIPEIGIKHINN